MSLIIPFRARPHPRNASCYRGGQRPAEVIDLEAFKEAAKEYMRGPARCLHCRHAWEARVLVGTISSLECPHCGLFKGVLEGLIEPGPDGRRWVCDCGCDLYYILPDGVQCLQCGHMPEW